MTAEKKKVRMLTEGALVATMALVLSYVDIPIGLQYGGSIDFVMVPIIIYSVRWGVGCGFISGLCFGTLKFFLSGGVAVNWQSMLLDYSLAYMMVGLAGAIKNRPSLVWLSSLIGCGGRFIIHFISGVTIYASYMPTYFMGMKMPNVVIYSIIYNISYMLPSSVIAVLCCVLLSKSLKKYIEASDIR